ncbi:MAG TPA: dihydroorotate dehydrogenase electron transfer subunit [Actinobacteria bacterium]|nr:dihydroorotate dehydrogenase electron transfer subunit [Actinomycetota bacterium]
MVHIKAKVLAKIEVAIDIYKLRLSCPKIAASVLPGQFVHVECGKDREFILRRPFSVHRRLGGNAFEILFQVVGKGTRALAEIEKGDILDVIGPLGNGFEVSDTVKNTLLIAGGIGVAPLMFLAEKLFAGKIPFDVLIGCANCKKAVPFDLQNIIKDRVFFATDDGSLGFKGTVTELFLNHLKKNEKPDVIYTCGPKAMLKQVALIAEKHGIACFLSLEERMACGIGACLSCVCKTKSGQKRVCVDGPIFDASEIIWE